VAKAFDTVRVKGLLYKLIVLNFPSYLVKTISSYLDCRTFQTSFQSLTSTCGGMRAVVVQGGLVSPVLFSLYVNDISTRSRHVELAKYAGDTALVATSRSPSLLGRYLEAYLGRMEHWLWDWRIAKQRLEEHCCDLCFGGETHAKTQSNVLSRRANTVGRNCSKGNLARDDVWRLRKTPPLVSFLVGWFLVGPAYTSP
jgi:hypothetical protein